ncbi:PREDICTED: presqualene diphosphate phosphatase-like isoform X2 [Vollenhovia emeryi]|uniref:presqualene diphosphate phosphatase-like isoform X2 n=1 Tax=Vollenhovia emeryi TaxID=411798 RepID=UPI0005F3C4A6|nr:PREDICTED: presqualene diphosphate phosphatase-like isoform X2 [Vollenhovia emeryi]
MMEEEKREIPSTLRKLLAVDAYLTNVFVNWAEQVSLLRQLKAYHRALDISCHSVAWLVTDLMLIWVFNNSNLYQIQVNLLIGLMLDIILVVILKAIARRRRPTIDGNLVPEKDSFPSGHSTRTAFITYFFINLCHVPVICIVFLLAWSFSVCVSRLLVRKQYIIDILAGIVFGIFQGLLVGYVYLEQETCASLVWWITEEKISGAEYDV